jgi:hypothetical protein
MATIMYDLNSLMIDFIFCFFIISITNKQSKSTKSCIYIKIFLILFLSVNYLLMGDE